MRRAARRSGWAVPALVAATAGCQATSTDRAGITLTQTPPTVQAAYAEDYPGTPIRRITRATRGDQAYYTFQYSGPEGEPHEVEFNEAGNEVDKH